MEASAIDDRRTTRRIRLALPCVLQPSGGSPIWAETIDLGEGGMSVRAARPLRPDDTVEFDLARDDTHTHVEGRATVLRHGSPRVYGLEFEELEPPMRERLLDLVSSSPSAEQPPAR
jgi:c-di-GMP-binding flagellar brake protein YcgR